MKKIIILIMAMCVFMFAIPGAVASECELEMSYIGYYGDPCCSDDGCQDGYHCTWEYQPFQSEFYHTEPGMCDYDDNPHYTDTICYFDDGDTAEIELRDEQTCEDVGMHISRPEQDSDNCGNGEIDSGEQCDLSNLDGYSCETLSGDDYYDYSGGELSCTNVCTFDTSDCVQHEEDDATAECEEYGGECRYYGNPDEWKQVDKEGCSKMKACFVPLEHSDCEATGGKCWYYNKDSSEYTKVNKDCASDLKSCYVYDESEQGNESLLDNKTLFYVLGGALISFPFWRRFIGV